MLSFVRGRTEEFLRACSRAETQPQAPDLTESHSSLATLVLEYSLRVPGDTGHACRSGAVFEDHLSALADGHGRIERSQIVVPLLLYFSLEDSLGGTP